MSDYSCYLITRGNDFEKIRNVIISAVDGGVTIVQLRIKNESPDLFLRLAEKVSNLLFNMNIPLIINDNPKIALEVGASGVHLGSNDIREDKLKELRATMKNKIIGYSINSNKINIPLVEKYADYLGVGAVFPTRSKHDALPPLGVEGLNNITKNTTLPVVAIGGINLNNMNQLSNIDGIAMIGAFFDADNPSSVAKKVYKYISSLKCQKN